MRTGRTSNGGCSPVGTLCTPSIVSPLSAAAFSRIAVDSAVAGTRNDPAEYDLPLMVNGAVARDTGCFALSSRLTATKASFTRPSIAYAPPRGAAVTLPCGTGARSGIFSNGPSKPSRMRSNVTPIEYERLYPVTSYGGRGAPPGYGMSSG